ncbi:MAG: hypothetical protein AB8H12_16905 [Lewinella sp.]
MEAFNNFSLTTPETILGGKLVPCRYVSSDGSSGTDYYDTERDRVIYPN